MTDDELEGIDLAAWEPPPPPGGLADAVVARMREPVQASARELGERGGKRRWWWIGAVVAAAVIAGAFVLVRWGVTRVPASGRGDVFAARATHVELGPSSAELDLGAELRWQRDGRRLGVAQPRGAATWRVDDKDTLVIDAAVASIEATGASLRVEVTMNPTDARVIGASAATALAVALVTVVVYEGHVKVSSSGQTVNVAPGGTVEVRPDEPPHAVLAVGVQDPQSRIRALEAELATNREDFAETVRQLAALRAKHPDDDQRPGGMTVKPPCDYATLMKDGTDAYAAGDYAGALAHFEQGVACKDEPAAVLRAFMSACKLADEPKARSYYQRAPVQARQALSICLGAGITEEELMAVAPPPRNVPPTRLEDSRIAGTKTIIPDDATKVKIGASGKEKIVGAYKLCLDTAGAVSQVSRLKSTGFADYDAKIEGEMKTWRYRPYLDDGKAVAVCTAVTFIYSQRAPTPAASCDADQLNRKGTDSYTSGSYSAALVLFEQSLACKENAGTVMKAFLSACKLANVAKARQFYRMNPNAARRGLAVCVASGLTEDVLSKP